MKFTTRSAAIYLGISQSYLHKLRQKNAGPTCVRRGKGIPCLYTKAALDAWNRNRKRSSAAGLLQQARELATRAQQLTKEAEALSRAA